MFFQVRKVSFPREGILQNAVLITFGQKVLQIFPCSTESLTVKPENAILAETAGVPGNPFKADTWGQDPWSKKRYSLLILAGDSCFVVPAQGLNGSVVNQTTF